MLDSTEAVMREVECPEHGTYTSRLTFLQRGRTREPIYTGCEKCHQAQEQERERAERERREIERRQEWWTDSGVDMRFDDANFEPPAGAKPAQRIALKRCSEYAESFHRHSHGLVLIGPTGTGKTHIVAAIARHLILNRGIRAEMYTARELIRKLRGTWRKGSELSEQDLISNLSCRALLAIDDLGVGFGSDSEMTQLLDVVDARYKGNAPTIVTTNATLPELKSLVGDRTFDRLLDGAEVIKCDWPTMRRIGRPT